MMSDTGTDNDDAVSAVSAFHTANVNCKRVDVCLICNTCFPMSSIGILVLVFYFIYRY